LFISRAAAQATAQAQTTTQTQLVTITGRVSDAVANAYLNNAEVSIAGTNTMVFTRDDGTYSIDAPAGSVTITVSYANSRPATRTIEAKSGQPNVLDFVLQPALSVPSATTGSEEVVQLERFTVTDERIGQAKVLMEQRAAENAKTIISTDQFGELTQGSIGEFMKYMPGITLDTDDEGELAYVRVGGLDPKYAGFSMDGIQLASATEGGSRANHFQQMSITAIESIEFNQTLLARMPANKPAGSFELKTRYAFNRKKPEISFDFGLDGTGDTLELGRDYMPDNKKRMRTYPGGRISYGGAFLKRRLGIEASVSHYQQYRNDQRHAITYTYPVAPYISTATGKPQNPNPNTTFVTRNGNTEALQGPSLLNLQWLDGPRIKTSRAASLNLDYKITPNLTFALKNSYTYNENEYYNIYYTLEAINRDDNFTVNTSSAAPGASVKSTLTYWEVLNTGPGGAQSLETVLREGPSFRVTKNTNYTISPRLEYKSGPLQINFRGAYSYSHGDYSDGDTGRFRGAPNRLGGLSWTATRDSTDSPTWTLNQTGGSLWTEAQNLSRVPSSGGTGAYLFGVYYDDPHYTENIQTSGYLDLTYAMRVFNHPVTFRAGGAIINSEYTRRRNQKNFNYIGPEGTQVASTYPMADHYIFNMDLGGKAGNVNEQNWPVVNQNQLWDLYQTNPEYFTVDGVTNAQRALTNRNDLTERIDALYAEATTRAGRFSFNLGARGERTLADVAFTNMRTSAQLKELQKLGTPEEIASGMFDTATVRGKLFEYYDGERGERKIDYNNAFLSGGLKFDFTKNLRFQFSMSQAILRPDYGNLAGVVNYPDTSNYNVITLWVPNPKLKPEETTKYYAGLQWYLNPAGIVEVSAYRLDISGLQIPRQVITADQAQDQLGYSIDDLLRGLYAGEVVVDEDTQETITEAMGNTTYLSTINAKGSRTVYGVTLRYDQQLTFLPGFLKGLSLFGSFTTAALQNAELEEEKIGRASKSANGGIKYRLGRVSFSLRGNWADDRLISIARPYDGRQWMTADHIYERARLTVDFSGNFRLNKNLELVWSIRNLTEEPYIRYSNVPGRISWYSVPDTIWNFSIRGKY
jgi:TonB-dependent receptor